MIKRILLVEDQQSQNRRAIDALLQAGYEVVRAPGPESAKRRLRENPDIDLVILDCIMPPECYSEEETQQGTATGIALYMDVLRARRIPVAIWSVLGEIPAPTTPASGDDWAKGIILRTRKRVESDELVNLVQRCEGILRRREEKA